MGTVKILAQRTLDWSALAGEFAAWKPSFFEITF
jgi:hypothetical protein